MASLPLLLEGGERGRGEGEGRGGGERGREEGGGRRGVGERG